MAGDVIRDEFQHLATRTDILEREVGGEKMVTRHILEQTRRNGDELAEVKTELKGVRNELNGLTGRVEGLDRKVNGLDRKVGDLVRNLPDIVGEAVRGVFREERDRRG